VTVVIFAVVVVNAVEVVNTVVVEDVVETDELVEVSVDVEVSVEVSEVCDSVATTFAESSEEDEFSFCEHEESAAITSIKAITFLFITVSCLIF
jgi:hypothetical protein